MYRNRFIAQSLFISADVAKDWLDTYDPSRGVTRIENLPTAARSFAASCAKEDTWVMFEALAGHDYPFRGTLEAANVCFSHINPR